MRQPKQTMTPGKTYRSANANGSDSIPPGAKGPWMVAKSRTHFLTGKDGLTAFFATAADALAAYETGKRCRTA